MANTSESSYGAKLRRAQTLVNYVRNFVNYAPSRADITIPELDTFLMDITSVNTLLTTAEQNYHSAVKKRMKLYDDKDTPICIRTLMPRINSFVRAIYGKASEEYLQVSTLISKIRETKKIKVEKTDKVTQEVTTKEISQSKRSFGSVIQYFNELVIILSTYSNYRPSTSDLEIGTLENLVQSISQANTNVDLYNADWRSNVTKRQDHFKDLGERVAAINYYVKAVYGSKSREYILIQTIK